MILTEKISNIVRKYRFSIIIWCIVILAIIAIIYSGLVFMTARSKRICAEHTKQEIVNAVFFHEGCRYTLFINRNGQNIPFELGTGPSDDNRFGIQDEINIITDVPPDKPMYVKFETTPSLNICRVVSKIHIHSFEDVGGGAWNHGKFGNGQTVRISP